MLNELFEYKDGNLLNKKTKHIYHNYDKEGYLRIRILGREYRGHRIIWELFNGPIPEGMLIDHIDGNKANNKIENLRLATRQQNNANSYGNKNAKIPYKGITLNPGGRYRARIYHKGIHYSLGTFNTIEDAKAAYDNKAIELNGEFAKK